MRHVTFTEFRRNASALLSEVEAGEVLTVLRHGKPIAEVSPVRQEEATPSWKRPGLRLSVRGASLTDAILQEREHEGVL